MLTTDIYINYSFGIRFFIKQILLLFLKSSRNAATFFRDATCLVQEYEYDA